MRLSAPTTSLTSLTWRRPPDHSRFLWRPRLVIRLSLPYRRDISLDSPLSHRDRRLS
jgi:hypothetical protein